MNTDKEVRYDPQTGERIITERYVEPGVERIVKQPVIIKKKPGFGVWLGGAIVGAALLINVLSQRAQDAPDWPWAVCRR